MKLVFLLVAVACLVLAALATPIAIVFGIYDWAANDVELKAALWFGAKIWISLIALVIPGIAFYYFGNRE